MLIITTPGGQGAATPLERGKTHSGTPNLFFTNGILIRSVLGRQKAGGIIMKREALLPYLGEYNDNSLWRTLRSTWAEETAIFVKTACGNICT